MDLARFLDGRTFAVLTGAGISTDSGIPDYRGPAALASGRARAPMTGQQFRSGEPARRRYWARAYLGWSTMGRVRPNDGHRALAALAAGGRVSGLITQNVDGLHTASGHRDVIDLHGRLDRVICLDCQTVSTRADLQERLAALNPTFDGTGLRTLPDGDVELEDTAAFRLADCDRCAGRLKPDVVFFGENVPAERVAQSYRVVEDAEALVVLGSSLHVFSGRRFVKRAHQRGIPVAIVNRGETRGDGLAGLKIDAGCAETLRAYATSLAALSA